MPGGEFLRAVEVTFDGTVYLATREGIDRLDGMRRVPVYRRRELYVRSDALTSDAVGNLYFAAHTEEGNDVIRLDPEGNAELIVRYREPGLLPFGLSFHEDERRIIGVRKERGEPVAIDLAGTAEVLNDPSGLITPISTEESPAGEIFVTDNGMSAPYRVRPQ